MSMLLYQQFQQHRVQHGPGPATTPHPASRTILMRGSVPLADKINRTKRDVTSAKGIGGSVCLTTESDFIRKIASDVHNGKQQILHFEETAKQQRDAENCAAIAQARMGDALKQALHRLESVGTTNKGVLQ